MKQPDNTLYLLHIKECIQKVEQYTAGWKQEFLQSRLIQDAVERVLQIMTESTQQLSGDLKARYPNVNWKGMSGFRNVLVHGYLAIDLGKVWEIVEQAVPVLKKELRPLLEKLPKPPKRGSKRPAKPRPRRKGKR